MSNGDWRSIIPPDAMFGVAVAVGSSMVASIRSRAGRWDMVSSNVAAAIAGAVVQPIAVSHGLGWGNWLGLVLVGTGISAGAVFLMVSKIANRLANRGDEAGDAIFGGLMAWLKRFLPAAKDKEG